MPACLHEQAADIVRVLGVGRNEYIAILNACKVWKLCLRVQWPVPIASIAGASLLTALAAETFAAAATNSNSTAWETTTPSACPICDAFDLQWCITGPASFVASQPLLCRPGPPPH
jgi:hypothetical protein